jgi:hypothetical protein
MNKVENKKLTLAQIRDQLKSEVLIRDLVEKQIEQTYPQPAADEDFRDEHEKFTLRECPDSVLIKVAENLLSLLVEILVEQEELSRNSMTVRLTK